MAEGCKRVCAICKAARTPSKRISRCMPCNSSYMKAYREKTYRHKKTALDTLAQLRAEVMALRAELAGYRRALKGEKF